MASVEMKNVGFAKNGMFEMSMDEMQANAANASALLRSMANESRLMILCQLVGGEKSVGELREYIPLSQSALSQHLAVLRREQLVTTKKSAQSIFYSLASENVEAVLITLYQLYCEPGEGSR